MRIYLIITILIYINTVALWSQDDVIVLNREFVKKRIDNVSASNKIYYEGFRADRWLSFFFGKTFPHDLAATGNDIKLCAEVCFQRLEYLYAYRKVLKKQYSILEKAVSCSELRLENGDIKLLDNERIRVAVVKNSLKIKENDIEILQCMQTLQFLLQEEGDMFPESDQFKSLNITSNISDVVSKTREYEIVLNQKQLELIKEKLSYSENELAKLIIEIRRNADLLLKLEDISFLEYTKLYDESFQLEYEQINTVLDYNNQILILNYLK